MGLIIFVLFLLVFVMLLIRSDAPYSYEGKQRFLGVNGYPLSGGRVVFISDNDKEMSSLSINADGTFDDWTAYYNSPTEAKYCCIYDGSGELLIKLHILAGTKGANYADI